MYETTLRQVICRGAPCGSGGILGRYTFNARNGEVVINLPTNASAVPEPSDLIGTALGGLAIVMLKRKLSVTKKG